MSGLYVFALTDERLPPLIIATHRIEFVRADDVYAAVARVAAAPPATEEALRRQHDVVAELAERVASLLPVRFGAFMERRELAAAVAERRDPIRQALALVRDRRQMTIRLLGDAAVPGPAAGRQVPPAAGGTAYLEARRAAAARPPALCAIGEALTPLVRADRFEAGAGRVAATLYHLIDVPDVARYGRAFAAAAARFPAGTIVASGPWPPFAFAPELRP